MAKSGLWTPAFLSVCVTNFLMFFIFYSLLPVLPKYLMATFHSGSAATGIAIALYALGALVCRLFAGFLVDFFPRKTLYLVAYLVFVLLFFGYLLAGLLLLVALIRLMHGLAFGIVSTAGNTVAIDVIPSEHRGEGIGYYGVTANLAFALGPMFGVFVDNHFGTRAVFEASIAIGVFAVALLFFLRVPNKKVKHPNKKISLDRFFLTAAVPQFVSITLVSISYGPIVNYMVLYANECGITRGTGFFYALIAFGLIVSRVLTGRFVDRGYLLFLIKVGLVLLALTYFAFSLVHSVQVFFGSALLIGVALGLICPGCQTMFVNMARHDQRGTASSTYLSGWDLGGGIGILIGGLVAGAVGYWAVFLIGAFAITLGFIIFMAVGAGHYKQHRLEGGI